MLWLIFAAVVSAAAGDKNIVNAGEKRKIDVWDMGGVTEKDAAVYNNNITAAYWDSYDKLGNDGVFATDGTVSFGDLTLVYLAGDRLYSGLSSKNYGTISNMNKRYADTYKAKGMYYGGDSGDTAKNYFQINNVKAGDKIVVYMGAIDDASDKLIFEYVGEDGIDKVTKDISDFKKNVFTAKCDGTYKIYNGKMAAGYSRIVRIPGVTVSGILNNAPKDLSSARLLFTNMTTGEEIEAVITEDGNGYSVSLAAEYEYVASLKQMFGYELETNSINIEAGLSGEDINLDLTINKIDLVYYEVTGGILNGDVSGISAIEFVDMDEGYTYKGELTKDGYSVKLIDGVYKVNITSDIYKTTGHVVVDGENVWKDLMVSMIKEEKVILERTDKIYVGYKDKTPAYDTVREAVAAAAAMNPMSEDERISISVAPGIYREQIIINTPYITLINETDEEVLITWYYGIGYKYYSADEKGFYSAEKAHDKYEKHTAANWGCTIKIDSKAKAFRAENIIFESSFNRYVTSEEIEDGVEVSGTTDITFTRKQKSVVTSKNATERAAAAYVNADMSEFYNCSFLSSQDTLYTGKANIYFKSCFIEGNTDFIFGDGNVVFDACEISLYGYSAGETAGYITAARTSTENGYLFRNCVVTADSLKIKNGYAFGRPWGAGAKVVFENTKLDSLSYIGDAGWKSMSNNSPENARFGEYNTTDLMGSPADVSGRVEGTVNGAATDFNYVDFLGYMPVYAVEASSDVAFEKMPGILNMTGVSEPMAVGCLLKVEYSLGAANDANDCSIIEWYRVTGEEEVLVKTSSVIADNTYTLTADDAGAYIKVIVRPENTEGIKGEPASYATDTPVSSEVYKKPGQTTAANDESEATTEAEAVTGPETTVTDDMASKENDGEKKPDNKKKAILIATIVVAFGGIAAIALKKLKK